MGEPAGYQTTKRRMDTLGNLASGRGSLEGAGTKISHTITVRGVGPEESSIPVDRLRSGVAVALSTCGRVDVLLTT